MCTPSTCSDERMGLLSHPFNTSLRDEIEKLLTTAYSRLAFSNFNTDFSLLFLDVSRLNRD